MRVKTILRVGVGLAIWTVIGVHLVQAWTGAERERPEAVRQLQAYFFEDHFEIVLHFERELWRPKIGDPIIVDTINDQGYPDLQTIGEVREIIRHDNGSTELVCWIFPHARHHVTEDSRFRGFAGPRNFEQVMDILMTPRIREAAEYRWNQFVEAHEDEVKGLLTPMIDSAFDDYFNLIRPELDAAVSKQEQRFLRLVERHYEESVKDELFPKLEEHGMPLFEEKMVPVLRPLGREMFNNIPKWRLGGAGILDAIPFTGGGRLERDFEDWLRDEGMQIIEAHREDLMAAAEEIAEDLANNEEIRGLLELGLNKVLNDPELGEIAREIVNEAMIDNPKTTAFVTEFWNRDETQRTLRRVASLAERYGTALVDTVMLAEGEPRRINPDLARVLRAQILWKDDFWLKLEPGSASDTGSTLQHRHVFRGDSVELAYAR